MKNTRSRRRLENIIFFVGTTLLINSYNIIMIRVMYQREYYATFRRRAFIMYIVYK